jgi:REP element-mobilizing transposase RayT
VRRREITSQLELAGTKERVEHGGKRAGAGRKRIHEEWIAHRRRPSVSPNVPVHVTVRMASGVCNLRRTRAFRAVERALFFTANRDDAHIVHFSVQSNHIHMLVEAADRRALSSAMRSLNIRMARGLNEVMRSRGQVIDHRYHARPLRSPTEVYRALGYVRNNRRIHAARGGRRISAVIDPCSSDSRALTFRPPAAVTWLLARGWRLGVPKAVRLDGS